MDSNVKVIMAYAIIAIGPILGSYMVVKNSSKLTGALMGGFNRVGKGLSKAAGKFARTKYDRSTFGTYMGARRAAATNAAQERAIKRLGEGSTIGRLARGTLTGRAGEKFNNSLAMMNQKIYDDELKAENFRNSRGLAGNSLDGAVAHMNELVNRGNASEVELHSAVETLLSHKGGKTNLANMYRDDEFMSKLYASGSDGGFIRGSLSNSGFVNSHSDVASALEQHGKLYKKLATQKSIDPTTGQQRVDSRGNKLNKADELLLGSNFISSPDPQRKEGWLRNAGGQYINDEGTVIQGADTDPTKRVKIANGVRSWEWIAKRAPLLIQTSDAHAGKLQPYITFDTALTTKNSQDFGNADPGIQEMINSIVAQGPTYTPPGRP